MNTVLRPSRLLLDGVLTSGVDIAVEHGRIVAVGAQLAAAPGGTVVELEGTLSPGMVDLHVHALGGCGTVGPRAPDVPGLGRALAGRGVTSFLATSISSPLPSLHELVAQVAALPGDRPGARCLGVHLEGPWISTLRLGAQPAEHVSPPDPVALRELAAAGPVRLVTLAPELPGAEELIATALQLGAVASMGHSDADWRTALRAVELGASHVTHCFNAMRGLHHRDPGLVGAALDQVQTTVEVIADGVHVHPALLRLLWRAAGPERVCLVSDAVDLATPQEGLGGPGPTEESPPATRPDAARTADGTLAGTLGALDDAVRTCVAAGIPLADALVMASDTPARVLGSRAVIAVDAPADLVLWSSALHPVTTWIGGVQQ